MVGSAWTGRESDTPAASSSSGILLSLSPTPLLPLPLSLFVLTCHFPFFLLTASFLCHLLLSPFTYFFSLFSFSLWHSPPCSVCFLPSPSLSIFLLTASFSVHFRSLYSPFSLVYRLSLSPLMMLLWCSGAGQSVPAESWVLELARKQRMNTDVRRNVFCILMTSEASHLHCVRASNSVHVSFC